MGFFQTLFLNYVRVKIRLLSLISKKLAAKAAFRIFISPRKQKSKPASQLFKQAEKLKLRMEGNILRGYRWNFPSTNKLLILHGFESGIAKFEDYIQPLIDKGYEVLGFDAPGHGFSDGKTIDVLMYKNLILRICREFGPIRSFLTHSFGGLALSLALEEMPHNDGYKVVFVAPATETTRAINNFFSILGLDTSIRPEFDEFITDLGGKDPSWYSVARASANIKAQVLFLQDEEDNMTPLSDILPIVNKGYPNFRFVISNGLGHRKIYRDKETIATIINFF